MHFNSVSTCNCWPPNCYAQPRLWICKSLLTMPSHQGYIILVTSVALEGSNTLDRNRCVPWVFHTLQMTEQQQQQLRSLQPGCLPINLPFSEACGALSTCSRLSVQAMLSCCNAAVRPVRVSTCHLTQHVHASCTQKCCTAVYSAVRESCA
jgi:hypothetical protein